MFSFDRMPRTQIRNTDEYMPPSIKNTFFTLRSHANIHTQQVELFVRTLAGESYRARRTMGRHLAWLIEHGYIARELRKRTDNPKINDKSRFTILRWDLPNDDSTPNNTATSADTSNMTVGV